MATNLWDRMLYYGMEASKESQSCCEGAVRAFECGLEAALQEAVNTREELTVAVLLSLPRYAYPKGLEEL